MGTDQVSLSSMVCLMVRILKSSIDIGDGKDLYGRKNVKEIKYWN